MLPRQICLALLVLTAPARADRVALVDGTTLEGEVEIADRELRVRVKNRTRRFEWKQVREVELADPVAVDPAAPRPDVLELYRSRRVELDRAMLARGELPRDDMIELADWCAGREMWTEARELLVPVLAMDMTHAGALRVFRRVTDRRVPANRFRLPLEGWWLAKVDESKHHQKQVWTVYGIDFFKISSDGTVGRAPGRDLDDYFSWDQVVVAPAAGVVEQAIGEHPDVPPGRAGALDAANQITIRHDGGELTVLAHLRKGSLTVKLGDRVQAGQELGRIGNSGRTGSPHLHFDVNSDGFEGVVPSVPWRLSAYERRFDRHVVRFVNAPVPEGAIVRAVE